MKYELIFDIEASKYLERLPRPISQRIFKKLEQSKENPYHYFERLKGRKEYKIRVGDYRVIADIIRGRLVILVVYIGHRRDVYTKP